MNCNGSIDYTEFVACLLQTQGKLVESVLHHAFEVFDTNGNGCITLDELAMMLGGDGPLSGVLPEGSSVAEVFAEIDLSHDGVITFPEFKRYLTSGRGDARADQRAGFDKDESLDSLLRRIS